MNLSRVLKAEIKRSFGIVDDKIVSFAKLSFFKDRRHKVFEGYKSYSYFEIDKYFGRSKFDAINNAIGLFEVLPYSKNGGYTKAIRPTDRLTQAFNRAIDQWLPEVDEEEHEAISKSGGIASRDINGNNTKFKSNILQAVQVDVESLRRLSEITPTNKKESRIKIQAAVVLDVALNKKKLPKNWIAQRYVQHKTGRLYSDGVSLQNCCREVRHSALNGLHSYDFDNCHYSILAQLTATPTPTISNYLNNKREVRDTLAESLGLPVDDVKQILIALIFGAGLGGYKEERAISKICGNAETYNKVLKNEFITKLHKEVTIAGRELISKNIVKAGRHSGKVINAMSLICDDRTPSKMLSHLLQGYEVKALEVVTSITKNDTAALIHDGWVTYSQHDKSRLERVVRQKTGLRLRIDYKVIECSFDHFLEIDTAIDIVDAQTDHTIKTCKLIDSNLSTSSSSLSTNNPLNFIIPINTTYKTLILRSRPHKKNSLSLFECPLL